MPRQTRIFKAAVALLIGLSVVVAQQAGWLDPLEDVALDALMRWRQPPPADPRIVLCVIDAASVHAYGLWPWPRRRTASLITALGEAGARVVALDMVFVRLGGELSPGAGPTEDDRALHEALIAAHNVVLGYYFRRRAVPGFEAPRLAPNARPWSPETSVVLPLVSTRPEAEANHPYFASAARAQGFFSNERRRGVQRSYDLVVRYQPPAGSAAGGGYYPALALVAAFQYRKLRDPSITLALRHDARRALPRLMLGAQPIATDERGALWINYRAMGSHCVVSARDVMEGRPLPCGPLHDAIVLVGATEVGIGDVYATPLGAEIPGVEIHAHALDNLLHGDYILDTGVQAWLSFLALLSICLACAWLVLSIERPLIGAAMAIALVLGWPVVSYLAFTRFGWHLATVAPMLAGVLVLLAGLSDKVGFVDARKREIRRAFARYVPEAVVAEMLRDPSKLRLRGERRDMSVLFCDLKGFTALAEHRDPQTVVTLLNAFFTPMTRLVVEHGGTLDKFMGDALMAFFGAPRALADHAEYACRAALAMREELVRLNAAWRRQGVLADDEDDLGMGIGVNSGEMAVGNMGSELIFDYTVIGDEVNLGARVEALTRRYGCSLLITAATRARIDRELVVRELDRVRVKGKRQAVAIFELIGPSRDHPQAMTQAAAFETALSRYRQRAFHSAEQGFAALLAHDPNDGPARVFRDRCRAFHQTPPGSGWDGVETLSTK